MMSISFCDLEGMSLLAQQLIIRHRPHSSLLMSIKVRYLKKDDRNYINVLGIEQLNTLENVSLLDIFLSKDNVIEPHYHQNAGELVYCIAGAAIISILNPFTKKLQNYPVKPGQVANVPQLVAL